MKSPIKILLALAVLLIAVSCKKDKPKHLVATVWEAETPVKYSYGAGGNNIGVGTTFLEWEILEMDFTKAEEGAESSSTAYYGSAATMSGNDYSTGTSTPFTFDWGHWKYFDYSGSKENKFKSYSSNHGIPQEWIDEEKVVGELFNNTGAVRFHVFSLSKREMRVAFEHINSFNSGTNYRYYSPIMTFKRK